MAKLYFDIGANYSEVEKLANTIKDLTEKLKNANAQTDKSQIRAWAAELQASRVTLAGMVETAAKAGGELGKLFKGVDLSSVSDSFLSVAKNLSSTKEIISDLKKNIKTYDAAIEESKSKLEEYAKVAEKAFRRGDEKGYESAGNDIVNELKHLQDLTREREANGEALKTLTGEEESNSEVLRKNAGLMEQMFGSSEKYRSIVSLLPDGLKKVVTGINGITTASLKFLATPLGAAIAAIALAFASLRTYLTKTEEGQMRLAKITGTLKGVMQSVENVAVKMGEALYNAFSHPLQAVHSLGDALKQDVVDRFTTIKEMGGAFVDFFNRLKNGASFKDAFDLLKGAWADTPDGKKMSSVWDTVKEEVDAAERIIKAKAAIEQELLQLEIDESKWAVAKKQNEEKMNELRETYMDATVGSEFRQAALDEYKGLEAANKAMDLSIINRKIDITRRKQALEVGNSIEKQKELNALLAERAGISAEYAAKEAALVRTNTRIVNSQKAEEKELLKLSREVRKGSLENMEQTFGRDMQLLKLEYLNDIDDIEKKEEEWRKKQKGQLTEEQKAIIDGQKKNAYDKYLKGGRDLEKGLYDNLLKSYQSDIDKRAELDADYLADYTILELKYQETGDERFKRSMEERTKAYEKSLKDMEKLTDASLALIFGNIDLMSKSTLDEAIASAEQKLTDAVRRGDISDASDMRKQLDKLREARNNYDFVGWGGSLTDVFKIRGQKRRLKTSKTDLEAQKGNTNDKETIEWLNIQIKAADDGIKKLTEDEKKAAAAFAASKMGETLGKVGSALKAIADATGDDALGNTAEAFGEIGGAVSNIANGFATGGLWGGIAAAVGTVTDAVLNAVASVKIANAEFNKFTKDFQDRLDKLKYEMDDYDSIFGTDSLGLAMDAYGKALMALNEYINASKELRNLSFKSKDYSFWSFKKDEYSNLSDFDIWGEDGLLDPKKAQAFLDVWGSKLNDEQRRAIENAIELNDIYEEMKDTIKGFVSGLMGDTVGTIADEMLDKFISTGNAIVDMTDNLQAFKKQLASSIIQSMLLENVFTEKAQDDITQMLMQNDVSGAIEAYNELLNQANAYSGDIQQFLSGINIQDYVNQSATGGAFQTMTQDQASELNGRFTALQISGENIDNGIGELILDFNSFVDKYSSQFVAIDDIRNIQAQSLIELQGINENTLAALKPIRNMENTISDIKRKVENL